MNEKKMSPAYRIIRWLVWTFYPKIKVVGGENLPEGPCVVVGNHSQAHGPIAAELHFPGPHYIWCAGEMMHRREVAAYAYRDFWSQKPKAVRWLYRLLSHLITPLAVCIFNNAHCIGVYHDSRVMATFRETVERLGEGNRIIIFPEHDPAWNNILYEFQDRFIDVARLYYRRTGKALCFVPMYLAPRLRTMYLGQPIRFRPDAPPKEERERVCRALMESITAMARALPEHTVVPYRNIPKKYYPTNLQIEVSKHEETSC